MPSEQHREFRSLVKYRKTLDERVNKMKNSIRTWFVIHGISIDSGEKAWNTGRVRINSFRKPLAECAPDELWKAELDLELTQLDAVTAQLELVVLRSKTRFAGVSDRQAAPTKAPTKDIYHVDKTTRKQWLRHLQTQDFIVAHNHPVRASSASLANTHSRTRVHRVVRLWNYKVYSIARRTKYSKLTWSRETWSSGLGSS